eukprot:gb/GECG01005955.1/.p1 GENE.gb/GECG01005955.1/~~gb/GECG01005955.1/.p1  ORF type:complete len:136 (+),score=15.60 gb/GECG01005955.1/:1-408(+)
MAVDDEYVWVAVALLVFVAEVLDVAETGGRVVVVDDTARLTVADSLYVWVADALLAVVAEPLHVVEIEGELVNDTSRSSAAGALLLVQVGYELLLTDVLGVGDTETLVRLEVRDAAMGAAVFVGDAVGNTGKRLP